MRSKKDKIANGNDDNDDSAEFAICEVLRTRRSKMIWRRIDEDLMEARKRKPLWRERRLKDEEKIEPDRSVQTCCCVLKADSHNLRRNLATRLLETANLQPLQKVMYSRAPADCECTRNALGFACQLTSSSWSSRREDMPRISACSLSLGLR